MKKIIILLAFILAIFAYVNIDTDTVPSHWNAQGEIDGYMSKFWGVFLFPLILIGIYLLFIFIPKIDPLKKNIQKFRKDFDRFIIVLMLFLFYIYILSLSANFYKFNMTTFIIPAIGAFFFYIGTIMPKFKRNWFIGIRTPWTLSSDKVWSKTHLMASKLFKIAGILIVIGVLFPSRLLWFVLVLALAIVVWVFVYSYMEFRKGGE